jgi:16S rRNA (uracil1498-N3)-methyltransferase
MSAEPAHRFLFYAADLEPSSERVELRGTSITTCRVRSVDQCTELGITSCIPFESEKTHIDRLRRVALSAMKQSFRSVLPDIDSAIRFDDLLARAQETAVVIVGDSTAGSPGMVAHDRPLMIVVGPEGGLTDRERGALAAVGARAVSVSPFRLRSETAAASLVALAFST